MIASRMIRGLMVLAVVACLLTIEDQALAQYRPTYLPGLAGLDAGSQPPPGIYLSNLIYIYPTDTVRNDKGDNITPRGNVGITAFMEAVAFVYVTNVKILGGNLGGELVIPWMKNRISLASLEANPTLGYSDTLWVPFQLGWHKEKADYTIAYMIAFPTGRRQPASGLDQTEHIIQAGTTVHLDKAKSWSAAGLFSLALNEGKNHQDIKVGTSGTVEWGVGKAFIKPIQNRPVPLIAKVGPIGYTQFKITEDSGNDIPPALRGFKDRVFAFGVNGNVLLPWTGTIVDFKYLHEVGARTRTEGQAFVITITQVLKQLTPKPAAAPKP